jgi:hypothetical protein
LEKVFTLSRFLKYNPAQFFFRNYFNSTFQLGAFSSVYLGHFLNDQSNLVAIKRIKKTQAFLGMNLGVECSLLRKLGRHGF